MTPLRMALPNARAKRPDKKHWKICQRLCLHGTRSPTTPAAEMTTNR